MSKQEKSKRLRKPNVYMGSGNPNPTLPESATPGDETGGPSSTPIVIRTAAIAQARTAARVEPAAAKANFDYSHIKRDLTRIAVLAGSFFAILIALSFFIK